MILLEQPLDLRQLVEVDYQSYEKVVKVPYRIFMTQIYKKASDFAYDSYYSDQTKSLKVYNLAYRVFIGNSVVRIFQPLLTEACLKPYFEFEESK